MPARKKTPSKSKFSLRFCLDILLALSLVVIAVMLLGAWNRSRVTAVPDGDSLDLSDGRRVRLLGLDAPEVGRCGSDAARDRLNSLVAGKHVILKNTIKDSYGRILADVFIIDPGDVLGSLLGKIFTVNAPPETRPINFVNLVMIREGLAKYEFTDKVYTQEMTAAYQSAKDRGLGVYSADCRQTNPPVGKLVKGNIRSGVKSYYPPSCRYYGQVIVDTAYGDGWFASAKEAQDAGFKLAVSCTK